eukprot:TRINITY_DN4929_c0_g1_i6.p1 TRINITY_DN4929_c0_g1~~TRINITY_DN4929_c0_g1_i6.p1  ORF type:complete len:329 (-),score=51.88 TRINITY_DN4929_c0_g1_i6:165-1151(-)
MIDSHSPQGMGVWIVREINVLRQVNHENVIHLLDLVACDRNPNDLYLALEYMDYNLADMIQELRDRFKYEDIKCCLRQILKGIQYLHSIHVLHRDIKPPNILVNIHGLVKLSDFGLARSTKYSYHPYTTHVVTRWYRAPELLLDIRSYGPGIDMWSIGCIFAEMVTGSTLFPANSDDTQLSKIMSLCGVPTLETAPTLAQSPLFSKLCFTESRIEGTFRDRLNEFFHQKSICTEGIKLIERLLDLNPVDRISADVALQSRIFFSDPSPSDPSRLPKLSVEEKDILRRCKAQQTQVNQARNFTQGGAAPDEARKRARVEEREGRQRSNR